METLYYMYVDIIEILKDIKDLKGRSINMHQISSKLLLITNKFNVN